MRRRGLTAIELALAVLVIGVLLASIGRILTIVARQQREDDRRLAAIHEAANHMERLAATPWQELRVEEDTPAELSPEAAAMLPGGTVSVRITEDDMTEAHPALASRRVEVAITWRNTAGEQVEPVRLVAWRFAEAPAP